MNFPEPGPAFSEVISGNPVLATISIASLVATAFFFAATIDQARNGKTRSAQGYGAAMFVCLIAAAATGIPVLNA